ncbi:hypothetical protein SJC03_75 [Bacteroides phage SJC03]|nr:hypothetical protein SJC03_75 [Bacteroides phage SJC03]
MAKIDKLDKEFRPKVVLTAEEMNEIVKKINEIVDLININIESVTKLINNTLISNETLIKNE